MNAALTEHGGTSGVRDADTALGDAFETTGAAEETAAAAEAEKATAAANSTAAEKATLEEAEKATAADKATPEVKLVAEAKPAAVALEQRNLSDVGSEAAASGESLILKSLNEIHSDLDGVRCQELQSKARELWVRISTELYVFSEDQLCRAVHDSELLADLRTIIRGRLLQELQRQARLLQELQQQAAARALQQEVSPKSQEEIRLDKLTKVLIRPQQSPPVLPTGIKPSGITELFAAINLEFDINPKNLTIGKTESDDDSTPALVITFILKMQWNSFQCIFPSEDNPLKLTEKEMREDELRRAGVCISCGHPLHSIVCL